MENTWVLVADSSRARLFVAASHTSPLTEFEAITHAESKQHEQKITSDLPGHQAGSDGRHHSVGSETDPKKYEAMQFARQLAKHLEDARIKHIFTQLVIVAAPAFLGQLREQLSPEVTKLVTLEVDKNLSQHSAEDIRQHLPERLPGKAG
jgi:protein required for attachment to host cells